MDCQRNEHNIGSNPPPLQYIALFDRPQQSTKHAEKRNVNEQNHGSFKVGRTIISHSNKRVNEKVPSDWRGQCKLKRVTDQDCA
jgi:hypothetical protein